MMQALKSIPSFHTLTSHKKVDYKAAQNIIKAKVIERVHTILTKDKLKTGATKRGVQKNKFYYRNIVTAKFVSAFYSHREADLLFSQLAI